jgi:hypothetical protein
MTAGDKTKLEASGSCTTYTKPDEMTLYRASVDGLESLTKFTCAGDPTIEALDLDADELTILTTAEARAIVTSDPDNWI